MEVPEPGPEAHVLVLSASDPGLIQNLANTARLVVALAQDRETLGSTRRALAAHDNVMVVLGTPDEIPWQEQFFDLVVDPVGEWPDPERVQREVQRVQRCNPLDRK